MLMHHDSLYLKKKEQFDQKLNPQQHITKNAFDMLLTSHTYISLC